MTTDTIGDTTTQLGGGNTGNMWVSSIVASDSGVLSSVGLYLYASAGHLRGSLWSNYSGGKLSGLLGQSGSVGAGNGWNDPQTPGATIVKGTRYYVAFQVDDATSAWYAGSASQNSYGGGMAYGVFVDPSASLITTSSHPYYMRMTYDATQGGTTNPPPGTYQENSGATIQVTALPSPGYVFYWLLDGVNVGSINPYPIVMNGAHTLQAVFQTTPITPIQTYIINWAMTPITGNLPFTVTFSGYLSQNSNAPDTSSIVNGETIQLQLMGPGGSAWVNTGVTATTATGTSGTGYFTGTWQLAEPGIYPGPWQFRTYYAGNVAKNMFGCNNREKKRDLRRVNALIL